MELFYNPERMSETEVRETFVAHQWLVDELLSILKQQPEGAGVQHAIIIAPRGMGKTTVLLMLRFSILGSELGKSWQPVLFPEESYHVYDLADFWIAVLNHLSAETGDEKVNEEVARVESSHRGSRELEEAALATIKDWRKKNKKQLLVLVDSFDLILEQIGNEKDHAKLRDVLMNDGTMMLIGGATTFFKEARAYDKPLYNLFKIYNLQSLNSDQIRDLLCRRAKLDEVEDFGEQLRQNASRLRVLEYFTGGNPRLVMMLYRVITRSEVSEVRRGLEKLLDEVTPYYKAKIESLPAQQRKILDHIARISARTREGLTPTEIATSTRLTPNQVSSQLKRLADIGYVRAANVRGRSAYYTLSEPLYAIWHQMRFGREARERMNWLVTFLKGWYDTGEINSECARLQTIFQEYLSTGRLNEARDVLEHRRYLVSALENDSGRTSSFENIIVCYLELKDIDTLKREVLTDINVTHLSRETQLRLLAAGLIDQDKVITQHPIDDATAEVTTRIEMGRAALDDNDEEASKHFHRAVELNPASLVAQVGLALSLTNLGKVNQALLSLEKAESHFPSDSPMLFLMRGMRAALANDFDGVEANLSKLKLLPPQVVAKAWCSAGMIFSSNSQFTEAINAFSLVNELEPENFDGWYFRADTLHDSNRYEEALESIDRALKIRPDSYDAHRLRGLTLVKLSKDTEAVASFDRALEINPEASETWIVRGWLLSRLGKRQEALHSLVKAREIAPDSYDVLFDGSMLLTHLDLFDEALTSIDRALIIDPNSFDAHFLRGVLLGFMNRTEEARDTMKRAFSVTSDNHRTSFDSVAAISVKLRLSLDEENLAEAKRDWQRLRERAQKQDEGVWLEVASAFLREAAALGRWAFARELIDESGLEEPLFPLARALDYLRTGDETLIEKLSPEVRTIVEEIVGTLMNSSPKSNPSRKKARKASRRKA